MINNLEIIKHIKIKQLVHQIDIYFMTWDFNKISE